VFKKRGEDEIGFFSRNKFVITIATLVGAIVGAGILGIPYVIAKAGFIYGSVLIVVLGLTLMLVNLFMGEVVLRTKKQHQLTGYAEKYLGKWGKRGMAFALLFLGYGALTAYLIGEGETLFRIFGIGNPLIYSLIFFVITFFIISKGVKAMGKAEFILISLLFIVVILVGIFSFNQISLTNFSGGDLAYFFLPYGVIFFALHASPAIPELQEVLGKEKKKMKLAIIIGTLIPIVLYVVFSFFIIGVVGLDNFESLAPNERIATIALSFYSIPILGILANLIAVLAMFTSFLTLGIAVQEVYEYDYGLSRVKSLLLTFSVPLLILLFDLTTFITIIGITGAIAGGVDGILITLMYWKAKTLGNRKPEYNLKVSKVLGFLVIAIFSLGIIYQLWSNFF
jgi:tyrosine-specific transport protein